MASSYMPLFGAGVTPDTTGNAFFENASVKLSQDLTRHQVLILNDDAADCGIDGSGFVPYISSIVTAQLVVYWQISVIANDIELEFSYRAIASGEDGDPAAFQQTGVSTGAVTVPGTTFYITRTTLALTAGNFAVNDLVIFNMIRDNDGGNDDAAADLIIPMAYLEFIDS